MGVVLQTVPLGAPPWPTLDPFLFCVHHLDAYPSGGENMEPNASLTGRKLGSDFGGKDGWSMYHGRIVPGFPQHPHRGFETVTLARRGYIDHSDSLGATARFGEGDAQWMTAGRGIVHSEMFPLVNREGPNPTELFQLWLNLPAQSKMVEPHFAMLWSQGIPVHTITDEQGRKTEVVTVAGSIKGRFPTPPPPNSWASNPKNEVAIWTIRQTPGARWTVPAASDSNVNRMLYVFGGSSLRVGRHQVTPRTRVRLRADGVVELQNGDEDLDALLLQGRPIGEPVAKHGPFVMNNRVELQQAFADYRRTQFGGWPWPRNDPVHDREKGRFAIHADGRVERPTG